MPACNRPSRTRDQIPKEYDARCQQLLLYFCYDFAEVFDICAGERLLCSWIWLFCSIQIAIGEAADGVVDGNG